MIQFKMTMENSFKKDLNTNKKLIILNVPKRNLISIIMRKG